MTKPPQVPRNAPSVAPAAARPPRALVFARTRSVPPNPEGDRASLDRQERACRRVAADLGAEVVAVCRAVGDYQQAVVRMAVAAVVYHVAYVIVADLDRLTRFGLATCETGGYEVVVAAEGRR